jgi:hypothetical protein
MATYTSLHEGRRRSAVVCTAELCSRSSMSSCDGAMAQSCDVLCDGLCDHRGLCVSISSLQASAIVEPKATRHMYSVSRPLWCLCGSSCSSCFNLVRGCCRDRRCFQGSMRTTGGPPDFRTPTYDSTLHLRNGSRCRSDKRLRGSVVTTSASLLKHKGHEGPQSIAFENGTSVPERHTTCGPKVVASTDCLKRKDRYDRYGHRKETLQRVIATGIG